MRPQGGVIGCHQDGAGDAARGPAQAGLGGDTALWRDHVRKAADFLVSHGPSFGVERWDDDGAARVARGDEGRVVVGAGPACREMGAGRPALVAAPHGRPPDLSFFTRFRRRAVDPGEDAGPRHPVAGRVVTVLAFLLVLFALVAPNEITRLTPGAFLRIPLEGLLFVGLVLVLPARAKKLVAVPIGVILGLLGIVKIVDLGFSAVLARPFNLVFDWSLFGAAVEFIHASVG